MMKSNGSAIKAYVLLPASLDSECWLKNHSTGLYPDMTPYGYHHAQGDGVEVVFSKLFPIPHGLYGLLVRSVRKLFGFDFLHIFKNLQLINASECNVVWTHTEFEFIFLILISKLSFGKLPPVICQSIWLADKWNTYSSFKRWIYSWVLSRADCLTFHSPLNFAFAEQKSWGKKRFLVEFGVSLDVFPLLPVKPIDVAASTIKVFSLGNDLHRDWDTLFSAFANDVRFELLVASSTFPKKFSASNIVVTQMKLSELIQAYSEADVVVIPLRHNLHASGVTTMLEAVSCGKPVVITDTGGLKHYLGDDCVFYVKVGSSSEICDTVLSIALDSELVHKKIVAAQRAIIEKKLFSAGFAERHVMLSRLLLEN